MRENFKRSASRSNGKLTCASARAKNFAVSDLREIAFVASLGQIYNIASDRARKFKEDCTREQRQINAHERTCEKCWSLRIARNRT